jgi:hypothetical protein
MSKRFLLIGSLLGFILATTDGRSQSPRTAIQVAKISTVQGTFNNEVNSYNPVTFSNSVSGCGGTAGNQNMYDSCIKALTSNPGNYDLVYTKSSIDDIQNSLNIDIADLREASNLLNSRVASDEAGLPAAIDQYAVQKLLDRINSLETRVKTLENQAVIHQQ